MNELKRIVRERPLSAEEAAKFDEIRIQVAKEFPGLRVQILVGNFKGLQGTITGYRDSDKSFSIQIDNETMDVRWYRNEIKPI
jgi:hypothetical protein